MGRYRAQRRYRGWGARRRYTARDAIGHRGAIEDWPLGSAVGHGGATKDRPLGGAIGHRGAIEDRPLGGAIGHEGAIGHRGAIKDRPLGGAIGPGALYLPWGCGGAVRAGAVVRTPLAAARRCGSRQRSLVGLTCGAAVGRCDAARRPLRATRAPT